MKDESPGFGTAREERIVIGKEFRALHREFESRYTELGGMLSRCRYLANYEGDMDECQVREFRSSFEATVRDLQALVEDVGRMENRLWRAKTCDISRRL